jgi:hypothetical protein
MTATTLKVVATRDILVGAERAPPNSCQRAPPNSCQRRSDKNVHQRWWDNIVAPCTPCTSCTSCRTLTISTFLLLHSTTFTLSSHPGFHLERCDRVYDSTDKKERVPERHVIGSPRMLASSQQQAWEERAS